MFGPRKKTKRNKKRAKALCTTTRSRLRFEQMESRVMLAGDVMVTLAGGVLRFEGDASGNNVEVQPGDNLGEYKIVGIDTDIVGPTTITEPFTDIEVDLGGGSDTFTIRGADVSSKLVITGDVHVDHSDGNNVVNIINTRINDELDIEKVSGTSESTLAISGSHIIGHVTWDASGHDGDSKTSIIGNSEIEGDLTIDNYDGEDIFVLVSATINGDVDINNRDGDTRTVLGVSEDPVIFGDLHISNGDGFDTTIIHDTHVWGDVEIDNHDGHTSTTVEESSFGLGASVGTSGDFEIDNGAGIDEFRFTDSTTRDDLEINNHGNADGAAPPGGDEFGSTIQIAGSRIGNDLRIDGDDGYDMITITNTTIVDDFSSTFLNDGGSMIVLIDSHINENFKLDTGSGNDTVRLEKTTVDGDVDLELYDGQDVFEILLGSKLLGSSSFDGGDGFDRLTRQIGPDTDAIEIAFMDFENFELENFITG